MKQAILECSWARTYEAKVLNPTASEASYKPEQRSKVPLLHIVRVLHTKSVNKTGWRSPTWYIKHFNSFENRKGLNKFWYLNNIVLSSLQSLMNWYSTKLSYKSFKSMKVPEIHICSLSCCSWAPHAMLDPHQKLPTYNLK